MKLSAPIVAVFMTTKLIAMKCEALIRSYPHHGVVEAAGTVVCSLRPNAFTVFVALTRDGAALPNPREVTLTDLRLHTGSLCTLRITLRHAVLFTERQETRTSR